MPLLFSYGSLQQEEVQLSTFGRHVDAGRDDLPGFESALVRIVDPRVVIATGRTHHANVVPTSRAGAVVLGMVLDVTDAELARSDRYEAEFDYARVAVTLRSGRGAWVYVHRADRA